MDALSHARAWMILTIAVGGITIATPARADDEIDHALIANGKTRYEQYCTSCHASGGAPGKEAKSDLRTYVSRKGGKFPAAEWLEVIADVRPGSVHSDVWDRIKRDQGTSNADIAARGIVGQIARYVNSIQAK